MAQPHEHQWQEVRDSHGALMGYRCECGAYKAG